MWDKIKTYFATRNLLNKITQLMNRYRLSRKHLRTLKQNQPLSGDLMLVNKYNDEFNIEFKHMILMSFKRDYESFSDTLVLESIQYKDVLTVRVLTVIAQYMEALCIATEEALQAQIKQDAEAIRYACDAVEKELSKEIL